MSEENTTKFRLDEKNLPRLSKSQAQRLDSMSDEEIEKAALSDPDNPPLTDEELAAFRLIPDTKAIRKALRLTQHEFATTFQLSLATIRDWEQGRYQPDQAARTLLRVIARDPKAVKRALEVMQHLNTQLRSKGGKMGIQTHFDKFHDKIKLGRKDDAYKKARERDDSISNDVKDAFKEAGYPVVAEFIQGSLATSTAVVPIDGDYDIDRALVIDADSASDNPVDPKIETLEVLESRGFKNAKIKKPCVTADYASDSVHIDFIIYKKSSEQHYLAVGKKNSDENNREWSKADPRGLIDWINDDTAYGEDADEIRAQFQRLVRYLKRWRDCQFSESVAAKVYSIGLTVMAKKQLKWSFNTEGFRQDLIALRCTVSMMLDATYFCNEGNDQYRVSVSLPKEPWRDIFDGSSLDTGTQFRNKLQHLKDELIKVEDLTDERKQCEILNKLFGDNFVVPDPPKGESQTSKAVYPTAGMVGTSQGG